MKQKRLLLLVAFVPLFTFAQKVRLDSVVVKDNYKYEIQYQPEGNKCIKYYPEYSGEWYSDKAFFFNYSENEGGRYLENKGFNDLNGIITFNSKSEMTMLNHGKHSFAQYYNFGDGNMVGDYFKIDNPFRDLGTFDQESYKWNDGEWQLDYMQYSEYDEYRNNLVLNESYGVYDGKCICTSRSVLEPNIYYIPYLMPGSAAVSQEQWMGSQKSYYLNDNNQLVLKSVDRHLHDDYGFVLQNYRYSYYEYGVGYPVENGKEGTPTTGNIYTYRQPGLASTFKYYYCSELVNDYKYNIVGQALGLDIYAYSDGYIYCHRYSYTDKDGQLKWENDKYSWLEYVGLGTNNVSVSRKYKIVDEWGYRANGEEYIKKYHIVSYDAASWTLDSKGRLVRYWSDNSYFINDNGMTCYEAKFDANDRCIYLKTDASSAGIYHWTWDDNGICTSYKKEDFNSGVELDNFTLSYKRDSKNRLLSYHIKRVTAPESSFERDIINEYIGDEQVTHKVMENGEWVCGWERKYNSANQCISYKGVNQGSSTMVFSYFEYTYDDYGNVLKEYIKLNNDYQYTIAYVYNYNKPAPSTYRLTFLPNEANRSTYIYPNETEIGLSQHQIKSCSVKLESPYLEAPKVYSMRYYYSEHTTSISDITSMIDAYLKNSGEISIADITNMISEYLNQ